MKTVALAIMLAPAGFVVGGANSETHAPARETGTMYGNNRPDERAARRWRSASKTARNFAFSLRDGRKSQPAVGQAR